MSSKKNSRSFNPSTYRRNGTIPHLVVGQGKSNTLKQISFKNAANFITNILKKNLPSDFVVIPELPVAGSQSLIEQEYANQRFGSGNNDLQYIPLSRFNEIRQSVMQDGKISKELIKQTPLYTEVDSYVRRYAGEIDQSLAQNRKQKSADNQQKYKLDNLYNELLHIEGQLKNPTKAEKDESGTTKKTKRGGRTAKNLGEMYDNAVKANEDRDESKHPNRINVINLLPSKPKREWKMLASNGGNGKSKVFSPDVFLAHETRAQLLRAVEDDESLREAIKRHLGARYDSVMSRLKNSGNLTLQVSPRANNRSPRTVASPSNSRSTSPNPSRQGVSSPRSSLSSITSL